jgi:ubiquitin-like protein Nedd8
LHSRRRRRALSDPIQTRRAPERQDQNRTPPQIFIKTLTGRKQAMTFEPSDDVSQIKQQLQEKEGIQVDQIRLIYSGKQLADDKPLEFYNIQAGGTIHMVLQLRGGAPGTV